MIITLNDEDILVNFFILIKVLHINNFVLGFIITDDKMLLFYQRSYAPI